MKKQMTPGAIISNVVGRVSNLPGLDIKFAQMAVLVGEVSVPKHQRKFAHTNSSSVRRRLAQFLVRQNPKGILALARTRPGGSNPAVLERAAQLKEKSDVKLALSYRERALQLESGASRHLALSETYLLPHRAGNYFDRACGAILEGSVPSYFEALHHANEAHAAASNEAYVLEHLGRVLVAMGELREGGPYLRLARLRNKHLFASYAELGAAYNSPELRDSTASAEIYKEGYAATGRSSLLDQTFGLVDSGYANWMSLWETAQRLENRSKARSPWRVLMLQLAGLLFSPSGDRESAERLLEAMEAAEDQVLLNRSSLVLIAARFQSLGCFVAANQARLLSARQDACRLGEVDAHTGSTFRQYLTSLVRSGGVQRAAMLTEFSGSSSWKEAARTQKLAADISLVRGDSSAFEQYFAESRVCSPLAGDRSLLKAICGKRVALIASPEDTPSSQELHQFDLVVGVGLGSLTWAKPELIYVDEGRHLTAMELRDNKRLSTHILVHLKSPYGLQSFPQGVDPCRAEFAFAAPGALVPVARALYDLAQYGPSEVVIFGPSLTLGLSGESEDEAAVLRPTHDLPLSQRLIGWLSGTMSVRFSHDPLEVLEMQEERYVQALEPKVDTR